MKTIGRYALLNIILFASIGCYAQRNDVHLVNLPTPEKFTLIDGMTSMEYHYMEFTNRKGDTVYAGIIDTCLTPTGYRYLWDSVGPPRRIMSQFLNKKYKVTYYGTEMYAPFNSDSVIYGIKIKKMELLK